MSSRKNGEGGGGQKLRELISNLICPSPSQSVDVSTRVNVDHNFNKITTSDESSFTCNIIYFFQECRS